MNRVIFTDLDGTLLDFDRYAYDAAEPALRLAEARGVPVVFCSSKTRTEQDYYREKLGLRHPFIVENGAAIFIPDGYFPFDYERRPAGSGYHVLELGTLSGAIRAALDAVRAATGLRLEGYADIPLARLQALTGLDAEAADRARRRDYSETIVTPLTPEALATLREALTRHGLACYAGGRFHTFIAERVDKGRAVARLTELYRLAHGPVETLGLGDSPNDVPMLAAVDRPCLVQKPDGTWEAIEKDVDLPGLIRIPAIGPAGWNRAVTDWLEG